MRTTRSPSLGIDESRTLIRSLRLPAQYLLAQGPDLASILSEIEQLHARFTWSGPDGKRHQRVASPVHVHAARHGPLALSMMTYGGRYDIRPENLGQAVLATTVLDGRMALSTGADICLARVGDTVLAADADRPCFSYERHTEVLKLRLPQARIDALCWDMMGHAGGAPVRFRRAALQGQAVGGWLSLLAYLVQSMQAQAAGAAPWLGDRLQECFILHLLQTVPHNYSEDLSQRTVGHAGSPREHQRARAFMKEHWQEAITLAHIADAAGCSIRTLTRVFQRAENATPMQLLQELRLQRVRSVLVAGVAATQETVANIVR